MIHTYIHTYMHAYIHTYIQAYTHTHTHTHPLTFLPQDEGGYVSRQTLESFFHEELSVALPSTASAELRNKLVKDSVETALESRTCDRNRPDQEASSSSTSSGKNESINTVRMSEDEAEKWLQSHPKEESFFSDILTAKFMRVGNAETSVAPVKRMPKLLGSSLLCE